MKGRECSKKSEYTTPKYLKLIKKQTYICMYLELWRHIITRAICYWPTLFSNLRIIYQNIKIIVCVFHSRVCETKKEKLFQRVKQIRNDQTARAQALNILPNSSPQQRPSSCVITFFLFQNAKSYFIIGFHYMVTKNL